MNSTRSGMVSHHYFWPRVPQRMCRNYSLSTSGEFRHVRWGMCGQKSWKVPFQFLQEIWIQVVVGKRTFDLSTSWFLLSIFFLREGGVTKILRNTNGGSCRMLRFDDKGGGGGVWKTHKTGLGSGQIGRRVVAYSGREVGKKCQKKHLTSYMNAP